MHLDHDGGCHGCDAFTAAREPDSIGGGCGDTDRGTGRTREHCFSLCTAGGKLGPVADQLDRHVSDLKSGVPNVTAPVYSHLIYDVIPDGDKTVVQPDILILEGLNVLQSGMDYPHDPHHVFVSDFVKKTGSEIVFFIEDFPEVQVDNINKKIKC